MDEENKPNLPARAARSHVGLRNRLFDAMDDLRENKITADKAKAVATLAHQICEVYKTEISMEQLRLKEAKLVNGTAEIDDE